MEAAEIEPLFHLNPNPITAHNFGSCRVRTLEFPPTIRFPGIPTVPCSPPQSWKHIGDGSLSIGWVYRRDLSPSRVDTASGVRTTAKTDESMFMMWRERSSATILILSR